MPTLRNRYRLIARVCGLIGLLFVAGVFVPSMAGIDGFHGGFALSTFSGFLAMLLFVSAFVYGRLAKVQDKLLNGAEFLAHWTYSDDEWRAFTENEHAANKKEKKTLFFIVSGFAAFFGMLWPLFDHKAGLAVSGAMAALIVLIGFVAWLSVWLPHRKNLKTKGEAYVGKDGAFLNDRMHAWKMLGGRLEGVSYTDGSPSQIVIEYSTPGGKGRQSYTARIPVPRGHEAEARKIVVSLEPS